MPGNKASWLRWASFGAKLVLVAGLPAGWGGAYFFADTGHADDADMLVHLDAVLPVQNDADLLRRLQGSWWPGEDEDESHPIVPCALDALLNHGRAWETEGALAWVALRLDSSSRGCGGPRGPPQRARAG